MTYKEYKAVIKLIPKCHWKKNEIDIMNMRHVLKSEAHT